MKTTLKREIPTIAIVLVPIVYLTLIWNNLPDQVPLHWNIKGEIDGYGSKYILAFLVAGLPIVIYATFLVAEKIDPKNKLQKMGGKLNSLKFLLTAVLSAIALIIAYLSKEQSSSELNFITLALGFLFLILGNYFKTIQPNYFLGIRTPWTLENETVWRETHKLAGKMWFVGGLVIMISSLVFSQQTSLIILLVVVAIITVIPIAYSYSTFQKVKRNMASG